MKLKVLVLAFLFIGLNSHAQESSMKFENVVNDQFGTLLESLLTDGKIDEASAKTYLEAVFGYDESVTNFLQGLNLSNQIGTNSFSLETLNSKLLGAIPETYRTKLMQNPNYIAWQLGEELRNGHISSSSIESITNMISKGMEENEKKKQIINKLSLITPTLSSLVKTNSSAKKIKITEDFNDKTNVNEFNNPQKLTNVVLVKNGNLSFTQDFSNLKGGFLIMEGMNSSFPDKMDRRIYKNPEKFDFSKDFTANFYLTLKYYGDSKYEKWGFNEFKINIGKGYILYLVKDKEGLKLTVPANVEITENYGILKESKDKSIKKDKKAYSSEILYEVDSKNKSITFSNIGFNEEIKLTIQKQGNRFTARLNEMEISLEQTINYFPDKYYLGFLSNIMHKNGTFSNLFSTEVLLSKIELEHL
ncbi:hypothetical protein [Flavobacterium sp. UBA6195]|uniref:hypothetical protein n=1 Tax=Flavobacterium sp. UBA6195 TaxID=1946554 RepID=UPI0025BDF553|nr:hypothetical protein [Flavobacterium sp. UBA6195]